MVDFESLFKGFKIGDLERIYICIYSYFIIGFIILFATFEHKFLELELHEQIFLMLGISFPITTLFMFISGKFKDGPEKYGIFYQGTGVSALGSIFYSIFFSLFYVFKNIIIDFDSKFNLLIALIIIILGFLFAFIISSRPLIKK